jgi:hypothetical protein
VHMGTCLLCIWYLVRLLIILHKQTLLRTFHSNLFRVLECDISFRVIIVSASNSQNCVNAEWYIIMHFYRYRTPLYFRATVAILENELLERCNVNDAK